MRPIEKRSTNSNVVGRRSDRVASPDFVARHRTHVAYTTYVLYTYIRDVYTGHARTMFLFHTRPCVLYRFLTVKFVRSHGYSVLSIRGILY